MTLLVPFPRYERHRGGALCGHGTCCIAAPMGTEVHVHTLYPGKSTNRVLLTVAVTSTDAEKVSLLHVDDERTRNYLIRRRQLDCHLLMQHELPASPASTTADKQNLDAAKWSRPQPLFRSNPPCRAGGPPDTADKLAGHVRNKRAISVSLWVWCLCPLYRLGAHLWLLSALRHDYMGLHGRALRDAQSVPSSCACLRITDEPWKAPAVDFVFVRWLLIPVMPMTATRRYLEPSRTRKDDEAEARRVDDDTSVTEQVLIVPRRACPRFLLTTISPLYLAGIACWDG
ncbi:hypothetical protein HDV57DRAFT_379525 [Trichoderma longibrachiatum]